MLENRLEKWHKARRRTRCVVDIVGSFPLGVRRRTGLNRSFEMFEAAVIPERNVDQRPGHMARERIESGELQVSQYLLCLLGARAEGANGSRQFAPCDRRADDGTREAPHVLV